MTSHRVVLSYAEIHQKGAYLNAKLKEVIYMKPPHGYLKPDQIGMVCRLLKGLYGIKQAGHEWYIELCRTLIEELGFT
jgi:hypothetical protein